MAASYTLEALARQEAALQFRTFTNEDAWALGNALVERACAQGAAIAIDIARAGQQLFHYAFAGTSPDNDRWMRMKAQVTLLTHKSSLHVGLIVQQSGCSMQEALCLDPAQYSASGGAFPLLVRGVGCIGTIGVSGFSPEEDHQFIVDTLTTFLQTREDDR